VVETWAKVRRRLRYGLAERELTSRLERVEAYLAQVAPVSTESAPVFFFNASTRIHRLSLNGAYGLLASWALRAHGDNVRHVVCQHGMSQCVLGALWAQPLDPPPCGPCTAYSRKLFPQGSMLPLTYEPVDPEIDATLSELSLVNLETWQHKGLPLGQLCLPSMRWVLRRHHLADDESTRALYRRYLASAASLARAFERLIEPQPPRALVVFNGLTYPEAVARAVASTHQIPVVTHEVGLRPFSAFFSHREATFRQVPVDDGIRLSSSQDARLDAYLNDRRHGRFSMAGIQFWPDIRDLPARIAEAIDTGRQLVTVFTNVAFDTSQVHANTLFEDMFDWLTAVESAIHRHPEIQFVIRAHPDEDRPGKASHESVADWVRSSGLLDAPNAFFLSPSDYVSSYELIRKSRLVLVYSSSVGLEASIEGTPVLCAGRARYTQSPTVILPDSKEAYLEELERWLGDEPIDWPETFVRTARTFLYTELFRASLDFADFLEPYPEAPGMALFKEFEPDLLASHPALEVVRRGILSGTPFLMPQDLTPERSA
jgi:hypothetical protein